MNKENINRNKTAIMVKTPEQLYNYLVKELWEKNK